MTDNKNKEGGLFGDDDKFGIKKFMALFAPVERAEIPYLREQILHALNDEIIWKDLMSELEDVTERRKIG